MTKLQRLSSETFSSLSVRNFRLFFAGQTVSQIGNWLTLVAQALLVLKITDSGFAVGLLTAFQFVPVLLLGAWAGLVADRSDKRKLLAGVQVFAMAQSFAAITWPSRASAPGRRCSPPRTPHPAGPHRSSDRRRCNRRRLRPPP